MSQSIMIGLHLSYDEMKCKCCGMMNATSEFIEAWNKLRRLVGLPIVVISGCRCRVRNALVGGSKNSQHRFGRAVDIRIPGFDRFSKEAFFLYLEAGFRGIGRGEGICHVDVREPYTFWAYENGKQVSDPEAEQWFEDWKAIKAA